MKLIEIACNEKCIKFILHHLENGNILEMETVNRHCIYVPYLEFCSNISMLSVTRIINDLCCQLAFYIAPKGAKL